MATKLKIQQSDKTTKWKMKCSRIEKPLVKLEGYFSNVNLLKSLFTQMLKIKI